MNDLDLMTGEDNFVDPYIVVLADLDQSQKAVRRLRYLAHGRVLTKAAKTQLEAVDLLLTGLLDGAHTDAAHRQPWIPETPAAPVPTVEPESSPGPVNLEAVRAADKSATPGPWNVGDGWLYVDSPYPDDLRAASVTRSLGYSDPHRREQERLRVQRNLEAIALYRQAAPRMAEALSAILELADGLTSVSTYEIRQALAPYVEGVTS